MYSCTISGMSREMVKMDAEIVPKIKSEKKGHEGHFLNVK